MATFTISEIEAASSALSNQLQAGISIREAVARMPRLQPKHTDLWKDATEALSRGGRLSAQLTNAWPEAVVAAIRAGEESGALVEVFTKTAHAMQVKQRVRKIFGKLVSPLVSFTAGFGVFMFFMVAVIPKLQSGLGGGESSLTFRVSAVLSKLVLGYWPFLLAGAGLAGVLAHRWLTTPGNLDELVALGNRQAALGSALRRLYFGTWAYQMALLDSAGMPIKQSLLLSANTLPECYRAGVLLMASEVEKRGIADAADPDKQVPGDPRQAWPFYIATAFITAHETGRTDVEMNRCAPILVDEGVRDISKVMDVADIVAKALSAAMISIPLLAYFTQMSNSLTKAFGG